MTVEYTNSRSAEVFITCTSMFSSLPLQLKVRRAPTPAIDFAGEAFQRFLSASQSARVGSCDSRGQKPLSTRTKGNTISIVSGGVYSRTQSALWRPNTLADGSVER